ncbi:hypothetical protein [Streptomyces atratus]|uniref:hypothetical protein n=1 Tax=Streptomyces atratus TaxID=1893 RepID=UPI0033D2950B
MILYAPSGRVVTPYWMDLALAGMALRPGTVLDGEAVVWRDGRLDFGAAQSRAASSVTRARALAARHPASYACWDLVQHPAPAIGDTRTLRHTTTGAHHLRAEYSRRYDALRRRLTALAFGFVTMASEKRQALTAGVRDDWPEPGGEAVQAVGSGLSRHGRGGLGGSVR